MDGAPSSRRFRAPGRLLARVERWRRQAYANSSVRSKPVSAAPDLCGAGPFNTALHADWVRCRHPLRRAIGAGHDRDPDPAPTATDSRW